MTNTWTIAYRKPRANKFHRVTDWAGTWNEAYEMAKTFGERNPGMQIYYVPTKAAEDDQAARIATGELPDFGYSADWGNVMVDSGKRIRMTETGTIRYGWK